MPEEMYVHLKGTDTIQAVLIRPMEKTDLPALEWDGEFEYFRKVFADVYKKVEKGISKAWVVVGRDEKMIGQVFLQLTSERRELADGWTRGYLYSLRVKPPWQNLGIGTRLVAIVEDTLLKMNYTKVTLNVARANQSAIRLYSRLGYQIVAEESGIWSYPDHKGVWRTIAEPSWRMEKRL